MIYQREIQLQTTGHRQMQDLTAEIAQVVSDSRIRTGVAIIFNVGSTGAIGTIEFEPGLQQDLPAMLDKLFPPSRDYGHEQAWHDGNAHSHLQATMLGVRTSVCGFAGRRLSCSANGTEIESAGESFRLRPCPAHSPCFKA